MRATVNPAYTVARWSWTATRSRLADPRHQRRRLPVPERHLGRAAVLRIRPAMRELGERQPDAQHQPAGGRSALARADRRRRRRQQDDRLQRHDHDQWPVVDWRQRRIGRRRGRRQRPIPMCRGGLGTRGQRQAQAAGHPATARRHGQGRAALRHGPDPRRPNRHRYARWPGQRGDRQLRADRPGWLVLPTRFRRARIAHWSSPTPRTATIPGPPQPRPRRS